MRISIGNFMPMTSSRSINLIAKILEEGYTSDRIEILFRGCGVPLEFINKYRKKTKFIFSSRVLYGLADLDSRENQKTLIDIAENALAGRYKTAEYYIPKTYDENIKKLELSLKLDGFELQDGKLIPILSEEVAEQEDRFRNGLRSLGAPFAEAVIYLDQSYDNFTKGNPEASNSSIRTVLQYVTKGIAQEIAQKRKETPTLKGEKAVRSYLKDSNFLDDREFNLLTDFYHWTSENGPHSNRMEICPR